jgi:hypothetical protein
VALEPNDEQGAVMREDLDIPPTSQANSAVSAHVHSLQHVALRLNQGPPLEPGMGSNWGTRTFLGHNLAIDDCRREMGRVNKQPD